MTRPDRSIVGPTLDAASATTRVAQLRTLSDPVLLRLLSAVATAAAIDGPELGLDDAGMRSGIAALRTVGLIEFHNGRPTASADALMRFGRLLVADDATASSAAAPPAGDVPPAIAKVAADLAYRFSSVFAAETVQRYVAESYTLLLNRSRIEMHVPSLTARFAAERLGALATAEGRTFTSAPEVLFVCVQNAGRSQIAAAVLRHLVGRRVNVRTAGSAPAARVHPEIVDVLDEVGIPIAAEFPKPLTDEVVKAADVVITMGCGDACPVFPGRRYLDWQLDDPVGLPRHEQQRVRDEIRHRVEQLIDELGLSR
ncbi:arsenate reductase ArsC [Agrococcus sp. ARC_14]|uniref:arsenate reductase ArsC n=1 Tax=Agrococcus sp. ARC_14 TaxID=2919927 RepID=UPI001F058FA9|nr:arsenate reductase ArsC [Agrococcus sp. ARC_14]MCH1883237.1 arsenate reductase ArsC [Agrococcus sp. ARC_14]